MRFQVSGVRGQRKMTDGKNWRVKLLHLTSTLNLLTPEHW